MELENVTRDQTVNSAAVQLMIDLKRMLFGD